MTNHVFKHLGLTESDVKSFAGSLAHYLPGDVRASGKISAAAHKILAGLDELASPGVCARRAEKFGISASLVREKVFFREGEKFAVAGLRFRKLSRDFPLWRRKTSFLTAESCRF